MIAFIIDILGYWIGEIFLLNLAKIFTRIGSVIFSILSFFKITPNEHYNSKSFDKKVGMFWTGLILTIFLIWIIIQFV